MDRLREIVLRNSTFEERKKGRATGKAIFLFIGVGIALLSIVLFTQWAFAEYDILGDLWYVDKPGEESPLLTLIMAYAFLFPSVLYYNVWSEPTKDEKSIMKERYGVTYESEEMDGPIENDQ